MGSFSKYISGVLFVVAISILAIYLSRMDIFMSLHISPLVIGIIIGAIISNSIHKYIPQSFHSGIVFCSKKILRLAIVLYGFRITFQDIASVGLDGFLVATIMVFSTFIIGSIAGVRLFGLDRDTSILVASGASVCGAAAVLATEPVVNAKEYKTTIAVSMVVLFGTLSMFLYPIFYTVFFQNPDSILHLTPKEFGIYTGSSVHEVAQVVAIPASIPATPTQMANSAVIVKLTRVIMIAPLLILLGIYL